MVLGRRTFAVFIYLVLCLMVACGPRVPEWVEGSSERYGEKSYLTAVASGRSAPGAIASARARLAGLFSGTDDEIAEEREAGEISDMLFPRAMEEGAEALDRVFEAVLTHLQIAELWHNEKSGRHYALAVLKRSEVLAELDRRIEGIDAELVRLLSLAEEGQSPHIALKHYRSALDLLARRRATVHFHRRISVSPDAPPAEIAAAQILSRAKRALTRLRVGVELEGDPSGTVAGGVVRSLAEFGVELAPSWDRHMVLSGRVDASPLEGSAQVSALCSWKLSEEGGYLPVFASVQGSPAEDPVLLEKLGQRLASAALLSLGSPPSQELGRGTGEDFSPIPYSSVPR